MMIHAAALLPVAPLLLLPFIIIFFIAIFPLWLVAMIVLGGVRGIVRLMFREGGHPARAGVEKAFRWVLTFGGLIHLTDGGSERAE
jgi:hypothetical protein